jgi:hypothetical protein
MNIKGRGIFSSKNLLNVFLFPMFACVIYSSLVDLQFHVLRFFHVVLKFL